MCCANGHPEVLQTKNYHGHRLMVKRGTGGKLTHRGASRQQPGHFPAWQDKKVQAFQGRETTAMRGSGRRGPDKKVRSGVGKPLTFRGFNLAPPLQTGGA